MNLEELREKLKDQLEESWQQIQDNPTFNNLSERYHNLTPVAQKSITIGFAVAVVLLILSFPLSYFSSTGDILDEFNEDRTLIRQLLNAGRLAQSAGVVPRGPEKPALVDMITGAVRSAGLVEEQITPVGDFNIQDAKGMLVPKFRMETAQILLKQLNVHQIADLSHKMQSIHSHVKVAGVEISPSAKNDHYFDVIFKMISYIPPEATEEEN